MNESPIFARTHDLLLWLIPRTLRFPREQRFVLARRLQDRALDLQEALLAAAVGHGAARAGPPKRRSSNNLAAFPPHWQRSGR